MEIWDKQLDEMEGVMSFEEAKKVREDLMHERKFLVDQNTKAIFECVFLFPFHPLLALVFLPADLTFLFLSSQAAILAV